MIEFERMRLEISDKVLVPLRGRLDDSDDSDRFDRMLMEELEDGVRSSKNRAPELIVNWELLSGLAAPAIAATITRFYHFELGSVITNYLAFRNNRRVDLGDILSQLYLGLSKSVKVDKLSSDTKLIVMAKRVAKSVLIDECRKNLAACRDTNREVQVSSIYEFVSQRTPASEALRVAEMQSAIQEFQQTLLEEDPINFEILGIVFSDHEIFGIAFSDTDNATIAEEFKISVPAVNARLCRIRKRLRNFLRTKGLLD